MLSLSLISVIFYIAGEKWLQPEITTVYWLTPPRSSDNTSPVQIDIHVFWEKCLSFTFLSSVSRCFSKKTVTDSIIWCLKRSAAHSQYMKSLCFNFQWMLLLIGVPMNWTSPNASVVKTLRLCNATLAVNTSQISITTELNFWKWQVHFLHS